MSWWKQGETEIIFACDAIPECGEVLETDIATIRAEYPNPHVSDFAACWRKAQLMGWRSFKRGSRPWDYFCPKCAIDAETAHRRYNEQENERERIKARNAR